MADRRRLNRAERETIAEMYCQLVRLILIWAAEMPGLYSEPAIWAWKRRVAACTPDGGSGVKIHDADEFSGHVCAGLRKVAGNPDDFHTLCREIAAARDFFAANY